MARLKPETMNKPKTKRQPATVATAKAKCHSDQRLVRRCAELQKRLEYSSIEASFAIDQRDKLWTALDELLNTAAVISTERDPECFVDLQTLTPKYLAAYKALESVKPPTPKNRKEHEKRRIQRIERRIPTTSA
mgnify:CR=1 FL=1